jgi:hypothetical protein
MEEYNKLTAIHNETINNFESIGTYERNLKLNKEECYFRGIIQKKR